jgi:stress response protein YsnF
VIASALSLIRTEDGVTIIPVLEEVLVVEKRLVLKREIRISKRSNLETVEIPVSLRKQAG